MSIRNMLEDVLLFEKDVTNPKFVKYLMEKTGGSIRRTVWSDGGDDYEFSFYGEPYVTDEGVRVRPVIAFKTTNGTIEDPNEFNLAVSDIRYNYDEWRKLELRKIMKRAGIATGIGLGLITIITGLALGLERGGSDMVRAAKQSKKGKKIVPDKESTPWVETQKATGKGMIAVGDYFCIIIGAGALYLITKT